MMNPVKFFRFRAAALAALLVSAAAALHAQVPAAKGVTGTSPVKARIWVIPEKAVDDPSSAKAAFQDVTLVGYDKTAVYLAPDKGSTLQKRMPLNRITACDFEVEYDRVPIMKALSRNDWGKAIGPMTTTFRPCFPYLNIPENNVAEEVMLLGTTMFKAARKTARTAKTDEEKALVRKQYEAAALIFQTCSKATWSSIGPLGSLKGCRCLLSLGDESLKTVTRRVAAMDEPTPGDETYGHYWLLNAEIAMMNNNITNAMDAAVKSVCFENKDVETFPDSLLITAKCNELLGNPYRARDIYFEVAKLFPRTDWAADALASLEALMASKATAEAEETSTESSFFGLDEDMNALAEALVKERKTSKPEPEDPDETEEQEK